MAHCLIIAAGTGSRMVAEKPKPLLELDGVALIERVIGVNRQAGIESFYVVSGYRGDELRAFLDSAVERLGVSVTHIINKEYKRGNGLSVTAAKQVLRENFVLTMCDHVYGSSIVEDLIATGPTNEGLTLAVDSDIYNRDIDMDDVTRVYQENNLIREIGKGIERYNCFDTGVFYCTPALFDAIDLNVEQSGDESLSGGVRMLALRNRAGVMDIGDRYWTDVDSASELQQAAIDYRAKGVGQGSIR